MIYTPRPYNLAASDHLTRRSEAALFTGMGLGKTASTLHAVDRLFREGESSGVLVVAPLRVANLTWPAEVEKWDDFSYMRVANLRTREGKEHLRKRDAHLYTCNYEMLPAVSNIENPPWDTVVFDELTRAKGHNSKRINEYRKEAYKLARRWGLTGTPAPNSYMELFAQIRLLDEGKRLGRSFHAFRNCWFRPTDFMEYNWEARPGAVEEILERISDLALVQRSSDFSDVADMILEEHEVPLPPDARKAYDQMERDLLLQLKESTVLAPNAAVLAGKLLQMTGGAVYDLEKRVHLIHDAKIEATKKLCKKLNPEPVLIACNYQHEQDRLSKAIPGATRFDSATTPKAQADLLARWNAGKIPALVLHPRSGGHGLNMQEGGRHVLWYSLPYSREEYDQLNARLHRSGQKDEVIIHHLVSPGTIDDAVAETLKTRGEDQRALLAVLHNLQKLRSS